MATERISITVLGAGLIGKRHVESIQNNPDCILHSIIDPTPSATELAARLKVPLFTSLSELFSICSQESNLSLPIAAVVATPSGLHVAQSIDLIKAGIHILVEKPLSSTSKSIEPLIEASKIKGSGSILVGHHRRFNPYILKLRAVLDSGTLGKIKTISAIWCVRKPMSYFTESIWRQTKEGGGGVILTNLSHELDLMRYLFGEITKVYCEVGDRERGFEVEETGALTLKFKSGAVGTLIFSDSALSPFSFESATGENPMLPSSHQTTYTICGTQGSMTFPDLVRYHGTSKEDWDWTKPLAKDASQSLPFAIPFATDQGEEAPFTKRLRHWVRAMRGQEELNCTLKDGFLCVRLLESVLESSESGRAVEVKGF